MKLLPKFLLNLFFISIFLFTPLIHSKVEAFSVGGFKVGKGLIDDVIDAAGIVLVIPTGGLSLLPGALLDGDLMGITMEDIIGGGVKINTSSLTDAEKKIVECLQKPIDELEEEADKAMNGFFKYNKGNRSDGLSEAERKQQLCLAIANKEGEESGSPSETFLWKPKSDSDGKAVTLLPSSLRGTVIKTDLLTAEHAKIETGRFSGDEHNGMRPHYRFSKPGSSYGSGIQVVGIVPEGAWIWKIPNGGQRFESGKGRFVTNAEMAAWDAAHAAEAYNQSLQDLANSGLDSSCPAGQIDINNSKNLKVMAMGDSNTVGIAGSNFLAYRKEFKDKLTAKGYTVDMVGSKSGGDFSDNQHEGYSGEGIARLQAVASASSNNTLTTNRPDVILLLVGSNDMWVSLDNRVAISNSAANAKVTALGTLLDTIHSKLPNAKIVLAKPGTPNTPAPLGIYKTGISTLASTRSYVSVVDFSGFGSDSVHYSASGYSNIAETFANKVDEISRVCVERSGTTTSSSTSTSSTSNSTSTPEELQVECKVSDRTPGVDDDIDIWIEVSGGKTPYDGTWSGDYRKADNFDKDSGDQTISFDKKGNYKIKITVEDADGEKAKDTCPTIKVSDDGEDDEVTVRVENEENNNTNPDSSNSSDSQISSYSFYRDLTMGSRGEDVVALQNFLISTGYLVMPAGVDKGYFGELTKTALRNWQAARGITPSAGYFGPKTRAAIIGNDVVQNSTTIQQSTYISPTSNSTTEQYYQSINTPDAENTCVSLSSTIYFGEENNNVGRVQQFLVNGGYLVMPAGASYGYYGRTTVTALSKFMANKGVTHNGAIMDAKVLDQIRNASCMVN